MPHSPEAGPGIELEAAPAETKPERQDFTAEQVTKTWRYLGVLKDQLTGEDPYFQFVTRLTMPEEQFIGIQKREAVNYRAANAAELARIESLEDPAKKTAQGAKLAERAQAQKIKLNSIFYMRKLAQDGDERMAVPVREAQDYLQALIARQRKKIRNSQTPSPQTVATLRWLEQTSAQLEKNIIEPFYSQSQVDDLFANLEKEKAEGESEAEKERLARLAQAVEKKLPPEYRSCAAEIVQLLKKNGFDFAERDTVAALSGKPQAVVRFTIFVNPLRSEGRKSFPRASALDIERALRVFNDDFQKITKSRDNEARLKIALGKFFIQHRWDFAQQLDAEAVLRRLRDQEKKPYAMYIQTSRAADFNLMAIEAASGQIDLHHQATNAAPDYKNQTVFSALPVFTFDIKQENK